MHVLVKLHRLDHRIDQDRNLFSKFNKKKLSLYHHQWNYLIHYHENQMNRQSRQDLVEVERTYRVSSLFQIDKFDPASIISTEIIDLIFILAREISYSNKINRLISNRMNGKYMEQLFEYWS